MKRFAVSAVASVLALSVLAGCGGKKEETTPAAGGTTTESKTVTLKIGATPVPHAEILEFIKPIAAKQGLNIEIKQFTDYIQPNLALAEKELDANFFQHAPYLSDFAAERQLDLISAGPIHLEPLGLYSVKIGDIAELKDGDKIAIPADATNAGRALNVLASSGLIKLKDGGSVSSTVNDIVENPKNLKFEMLDAEVIAPVLPDVAAAVINGNYYLEANKAMKLNAKTLAVESANANPYNNIIAIRRTDDNNPNIKKLMKILQSPEVKQFIQDTYGGAVTPAF